MPKPLDTTAREVGAIPSRVIDPRSSAGASERPPVSEFGPAAAAACEEILRGLRAPRKRLPSKLFYDARGAALFDRITELEAYYPTRTELGILETHVGEIAALVGPGARVVEFGSGSGRKTRLLLAALDRPAAYVPVDIARVQLEGVAAALAAEFPAVRITPVAADYTTDFALPTDEPLPCRTIAFFPGSTIGNFEPEEAERFLRRVAGMVGEGGALLIGVDLKKDVATLERAYNDAEGVTAAFNLNILAHVNRICGADFDLHAFEHYAFYDECASRIEMHLVSRRAQVVHLPKARGGEGATVCFRPGEHITTEHSYKFDVDGFGGLAGRAGFRVERVWADSRGYFAVLFLVVARG